MKKNGLFETAAFALALATTAGITSCSNDDKDAANSGRVAVQFSATSIDIAQTRASGTDWADGDLVGISMVENGSTEIVDGAQNKQYEFKGGAASTATVFSAVSDVIY